MLIPVRCWSCGKVIAHKYEEYKEATVNGEDTEELDQCQHSKKANASSPPMVSSRTKELEVPTLLERIKIVLFHTSSK